MKKLSLIALAFTAPLLARAEKNIPDEIKTIDNKDQVIDALRGITDWIFSAFLVWAVIMILWAAYGFLMAGGDSEKFSQARKSILYAAIAIAIAVLSKSIVIIAANLAGGDVRNVY